MTGIFISRGRFGDIHREEGHEMKAEIVVIQLWANGH